MFYEMQQLQSAITSVVQKSENRHGITENRTFSLESRVAVLEEFMKKAQPYIDTLALIDPEPPKSE